MKTEKKPEELYQYRNDWSSFYGNLYTRDYQIGDIITWLGHDNTHGYLFGEKFRCTDIHYQYKMDRIQLIGYDDLPVYKEIGTFDIRGTIFPYNETLSSIIKRDPRKALKYIWQCLPTQWWSFEGHWVKTKWRYVLQGKFNRKNLKLGRP